jgi:pantoate kinase
MKEASAHAPGHLTGFFQICDEPEDPLRKGARGSGVSIIRGVNTRIRAEPSDRGAFTISIDGEITDEAFVSENVLNRMTRRLEEPQRIIVEHELKAPLGAGFGSSGGGALTLALALNDALDLGLSTIEAAQVAHVAEIECRTGLGSVFAALEGGFGALIKPGGPGIGEAVRYDRSDELAVVYLHFGPIPTKDALADEGLRRRINELGGRFVDEISGDLSPSRFMELSRRFTDHVGIATPRLRSVLDEASRKGVPCTMAMFGEVAFSLVERSDALRVAEFLSKAAPGHEVIVTYIDERGARLT